MILECSALTCFGKVSPLYNIILVLITFYLLWCLINLKNKRKEVFLVPWYYLFAAIGFFLLESLLTALKFFNIISEAIVPRWFNAVFELIIIIIIIYMLFIQVNHVHKNQ